MFSRLPGPRDWIGDRARLVKTLEIGERGVRFGIGRRARSGAGALVLLWGHRGGLSAPLIGSESARVRAVVD